MRSLAQSVSLPVLLRGEPEGIRVGIERLGASQLCFYATVIIIGAGAFGAATGCWRAPEQAVYTAIKLPLAILLTTLGNALLNGLLAPLFGLNLRFSQSLLAVLASGTIACAILGGFSPLLLFLVWNTPPNVSQATSSAYNVVMVAQVLMIAFAGMAANVRLFQLLTQFTATKGNALKVLFGWLAGNLVLGSQLCWIMRPFIGSPDLPVQFLRADAFRGNFFEAVWWSLGEFFNTSNIMNESQPPKLPATIMATATIPLGESPEDRLPIYGPSGAVEAILRQPRRVMFQLQQSSSSRLIGALVLVALGCALVYGLVVGAFSGAEQLWAAPVKIAVGMLVCALICLPSLYIFSCLSGSRARLGEVIGLVAGLLLLMTLLLIGFAPVAWVFSQSTESVAAMGALHIVFWFIAVYFGVRFLSLGFKHLSASSTGGLNVWIVLFVLVCLQMTTALRPLVGKAETFLPQKKRFFLTHWIDSLDASSKTRSDTQASR